MSATEQTTAQEEQAMCAAVPKAARSGWRDSPGCASHANAKVQWAGQEWPVCQMHVTTMQRARERDGERAANALAALWGWRKP